MSGYNVWVLSQSGLSEEDYYKINILTEKYYFINITEIVLCGSISDSQIEQSFKEQNPAAVILAIDRTAPENPQYRKWGEVFRKQLSNRDDFRIFIHLQDFTLDEFNDRCDSLYKLKYGETGYEACDFLYNLRDTVQISKDEDISQSCNELTQFLSTLGAIRDQVRYRGLRLRMSIALGWAAAALQVASALFVAVCTVIRLFYSADFLADKLAFIPDEYVAILSAFLWCPTTAVVIYMIGRGVTFIGRFIGKNRNWKFIMIAVMLLGIASTGIPGAVGASNSWISVGIAAGIILDLLRRSGRMAKRERFALKKEVCTPKGQPLPMEIKKTAEGFFPNPFSCPLLPDERAKVFISYTHSSQWAQGVVQELYRELRNFGAECFLDQYEISPGSSWRRRLHQKMVGANVFISVVDKLSITKEWPAAEMETAMAGKYLTGLPEIIVLTEPGLSASGEHIMPVYNSIFGTESRYSEEDIRIIEVKENNIRTIASGFKAGSFNTGAVIPPWVMVFLNFFQLIPGSIGPFGTLTGFLLLVAAFLDKYKAIDLNAWLASGNLLNVLFLLSCFWLGFIVKLIFATKYEVNIENTAGTLYINILAIIGFLYIIYNFAGRIPSLFIGWSAVLCTVGFYSAKAFIYTTSKWKKSFLRAEM